MLEEVGAQARLLEETEVFWQQAAAVLYAATRAVLRPRARYLGQR